jgi:Tfp pilus assembly protein PilF
MDNTSNSLELIGNLIAQKSTAVMLLGYYLLIMLLPYRLMSDGSFNEFPAANFYDIRFLIPLAIFIAAFVFAIINLKRNKPESFFILFFFLAAAPVSNIFLLIGTNYGERLMLAPSLAICTLISLFLFRIFPAKLKSKIQHADNKPIYISVFVILIYSFVTVSRAADWKDESVLFRKDAQTAINSARAQYYFGNQFAVKLTLYGYSPELQEEVSSALDALHRAVEIRPDYHEAYYSLGEIFERTGNLDSAAINYRKAVELNPMNAYYPLNYGNVMGTKGDLQTAEKYFRLAIKIDSTYRDAWLNLGITYLQKSKEYQQDSLAAWQKSDHEELNKANSLLIAYSDTAIHYVEKSITIDPSVAYGYQVLGTIYTIRNEMDKANENFAKAGSLR